MVPHLLVQHCMYVLLKTLELEVSMSLSALHIINPGNDEGEGRILCFPLPEMQMSGESQLSLLPSLVFMGLER